MPSSNGERAGEPMEGKGGATQRALTPPPLPRAADATVARDIPRDESRDASSAPTLRPPPGPVASATSTLAVSAFGTERRGTGFTSVIRHLSLRGWLRWIHSNQCDATLRVRARDGGNGSIWCSAGTIVDAEWGALVAEAAVQQMLRLGSGSVSIDFDPVDRAPRVSRPTHELLHPLQLGAVLADGRSASERHWSPASMQDPAIRPALTAAADNEEAQPSAHRWPPRLRWRHVSRGSYLVGGISFAALMLLAFIIGRSRGARETELVSAPEAERAQQIRSGLLPPPAVPAPAVAPSAGTQPPAPVTIPSPAPRPRELPVIGFAALEVEPAQAEIWLDQSLVGVGRIDLAAMPDGALHELRFVAAGHTPRSIYFVEQPPAGRVILERTGSARAAPREPAISPVTAAESEPVAAATARAAPPSPAREREVVRSVPRRRASPPASRPAAEAAVTAAKAAPVKKSPQIQLIDARVPRVQVLE